jgi:hypothetical protein
VSINFVKIDIIYGVGVSDEGRSSLIEPVGRTMRYRSSKEVFKALDSCLLTTADSSPDRWMFLAALLLVTTRRQERPHPRCGKARLINFFIKKLWRLRSQRADSNGRCLTDCARNFQLSNRSSSSATKIVLPTLEGRRWREYFSKLSELWNWNNERVKVT